MDNIVSYGFPSPFRKMIPRASVKFYFTLLILILALLKAQSQAIDFRLDNDAFYRFDPTDHLYTAGAELAYRFKPSSQKQNSIFFEYKMFTPFEPEEGDTILINQPNTAYFAVGFQKISYSENKQFLFESSVRIGIQGEEAQGEEIQLFIHKIFPFVHDKGAYGWDEQLGTNPIFQLNFNPGWIYVSPYFASKLGCDFGLGSLENYAGLQMDLYIGFLGEEAFLVFEENDYLRIRLGFSSSYVFFSGLDSGSMFANDPNGLDNADLEYLTNDVFIGTEVQLKWIYTSLGVNFKKTRYPELPWHHYVSLGVGVIW